jgi:hypothetical protein
MITISTRDYTTEQLRYLAEGLVYTSYRIFDSPECQKYTDCTTACKAYAICHDIGNARQYIWKKIKERETLELHRDTQESK